jgi:hypothetical protein
MTRSRRTGILCVVTLALAALLLWRAGDRVGPREREGEATRTGVAAPGAAASVRRDGKREEGAATTAPVLSPDCVLTVLNDAGVPAARAWVALFSGEDLLSTGRTDRDGTVDLVGSSAPCSVAVFPLDGGPSVQQLSEVAGEVAIRLPKGAVVSGRVESDGGPPAKPMTLALEQHDYSRLPGVWPASVDRWLTDEAGHLPWFMKCDTGPSGQFRFAGLSSGSTLCLRPRGDHHVLESPDPRALWLQAPAADVVLSLRRNPGVTGRVVTSGTRRPVPGAHVFGSLSYEGGGVRTCVAQADDEGSFFLWIPDPAKDGWPSGATVQVRTAANSGMRQVDVPPHRFTPGASLGDLETGATRLLSYRVTDRAGKPVAGAFIRTRDREQAIESTSDRDGRGTIEAPLERVELTAGAFGFRSTTATVAENPAGELPLLLDAACVLHVQVRSEGGGRLSESVRVEVASEQPIFEGAPGTWWEWERSGTLVRLQPDHAERSEREDGQVLVYSAPDVKLSGIRPGVAMRITVRDSLCETQAAEALVLREGEQRSIELFVPRRVRALRGRVSAPDGTPVYRAGPRLMPLSRRYEDSVARTTARDGTFVFEAVLADRVLLSIEGTSWIRELDVPAEGLFVEVRLEDENQEVVAEVLDEQDRPVKGVEVSVRSGAFLDQAKTNDEGRVRIGPVPAGDFLVEAHHGNVKAAATARVPGSGATLSLPPHGTVEVEPRSRNVRTIRLEPLGGGDAIEWKEGSLEIRGLSPGRYRARIDCWIDEEIGSTLTLPEREIVVNRGETTRVKLGE